MSRYLYYQIDMVKVYYYLMIVSERYLRCWNVSSARNLTSYKKVTTEHTVLLIHSLLNGIYSGYPKCCIMNFIYLSLQGYYPAEYMWEIYGEDDDNYDYVRCDRCRHRGIAIEKSREGGVGTEYLEITDEYQTTLWRH